MIELVAGLIRMEIVLLRAVPIVTQQTLRFVRIEEKTNYVYRLSTMVGKFLRLFRAENLCQDSLRPLVRFCCFDYTFLQFSSLKDAFS